MAESQTDRDTAVSTNGTGSALTILGNDISNYPDLEVAVNCEIIGSLMHVGDLISQLGDKLDAIIANTNRIP